MYEPQMTTVVSTRDELIQAIQERLSDSAISIETMLPEALYEAGQKYLANHPGWDQDRIMQAALSLFLLQNGECDRAVSRIYLDTLFNYEA